MVAGESIFLSVAGAQVGCSELLGPVAEHGRSDFPCPYSESTGKPAGDLSGIHADREGCADCLKAALVQIVAKPRPRTDSLGSDFPASVKKLACRRPHSFDCSP